jgi:hypothetical protein
MKVLILSACVTFSLFALLMGVGTANAWPAPQDQQKLAYSSEEYDMYMRAHEEKDSWQKIKLLDDFVKQYPNSTLMSYVYRDYFLTNYELKNFARTMDYADREIALGDKIDALGRLEAEDARAQAYYGGQADQALQTADARMKARDAAVQGLKTVDDWKRPDAIAEDAYVHAVKRYKIVFNMIAAMTSKSLRDYASAANYYKSLLEIDQTDAVSHSELGLVELQMTPLRANDGFWELARAIALKAPNSPALETYLKNKLIQYQQPACDNLVEDQVSQLITLATSSVDRPATLNLPSAADLQKARDNTANMLPVLKAGGDAGNVMWLASCGLESQDVWVRVMEVPQVAGDIVTLKVFGGETLAAEAATAPNMEVKVVGQPEAKRLEKGSLVRFTGTLVDYSRNNFLLAWDNAKINAEDLPVKIAAPAASTVASNVPPARPDTGHQVQGAPAARGVIVAASVTAEKVQSTANTGHNYALLIANDHYIHWPGLKNPINDARDVEGELTRYYDFEATEAFDKPKRTIIEAIKDYYKLKYSNNDQLFIYIAGHGSYAEDEQRGFLIAADSLVDDPTHETQISHDDLRAIINKIPIKHVFVVIDACYGGTFDPRITDSVHRGGDDYASISLDELRSRKVNLTTRQFLTSGDKDFVSDGTGNNSPFARVLLQKLRAYGGSIGYLSVGQLRPAFELSQKQARYGPFGDDDPGSEFFFVPVKSTSANSQH